MEIVNREPRLKQRKITLHKNLLLHDIDVMSYKLAETSLQGEVRDNVASDSEDGLDGAVIGQLLEAREAALRKKLAFCLKETEIIEIDNVTELEGTFVYDLVLPESFKDIELRTAVKLMHDCLVKGVLMDWYVYIGTNFGNALAAEVVQLESKVVDIFRKPGFVNHASAVYYESYKIR